MCGKEVDFDQPWCDHETMEESAWLDIAASRVAAAQTALNVVIDEVVKETAEKLWHLSKEKHLGDLAHVYQHNEKNSTILN